MNEFKQREEEMNNTFNELENEFFNEQEKLHNSEWEDFETELNNSESS